MARFVVLTGTGLAPGKGAPSPLVIETPYGDVATTPTAIDGHDVFHIARHGPKQAPAHAIPHRANVAAAAACRPDAVLGIHNVGALDPAIEPGALVVPHDLLDLGGPPATFHEDDAVHVDMGEPFCPDLRARLVAAAKAEGALVRDGGVYAQTRGPRLETHAEVRALRTLGGTVVGMTAASEAALAREKALCYASLAVVANAGAGLRPQPLAATSLRDAARAMAPLAWRVVERALRSPRTRACACGKALDGARV